MSKSIKIIIIVAIFCQTSLFCKYAVDYIVVGVGTAGAVVAKKLSDDKKTSVIAIHDGENLNNVPLIKFSKNAILSVLSGLTPTSLYERGKTVPQVQVDMRQLLWVIARPGGGTSAVNVGAYCRQTHENNIRWEKVAGHQWSPEKILETYKELEHYHGQTSNPDARGFNGPISVRQFPHPTIVSQKFTQAIINATGFAHVVDYNDPLTPIGPSSQFQYTQSGKQGKFRVSSATAFLNEKVMTPDGHGVNGRKLRVYFKSKAIKVIWEGNKAAGVKFAIGGKKVKAFANKGVIICAGFNSSFILMKSGIGDKKLLKKLGIPVVVDNKNVGANLIEQPLLLLVFKSDPNDTPISPADPNGFFSQIAWLPDPTGDQKIRKLRFATADLIPGTTVAVFDLLQPESRGKITINNRDQDKPIIDLGIFSNPADLELYKRGLQIYVKNINDHLKLIDPKYGLAIPDPAIFDDDEATIAYIKATVVANHCYQSHCRMAPRNEGGVVDSHGRVYGVEGLYVADNSIVPVGMDGSPMASAYLVGARVADMIIEHNKQDRINKLGQEGY